MTARDQKQALRLLDEIERWSDLGVEDFLPEWSRKVWRKTTTKITRYLDRMLGPKPRRTK